MNMVDDVRGVGAIKMMMVDDMGEGGVENDQKSDDVISGRPQRVYQHFFEILHSYKRSLENQSSSEHF